MTELNKTIYAIAADEIGVEEWPGARHNPRVLEYYKESGHAEIKSDEVPWCAAFVGAVLAKAGAQGTGQLTARSYSKWGDEVTLPQAQRGDIVVLSRGEPWQGHVGFFHNFGDGKIELIGGNQGNKVSIAAYDRRRIVAIRRAKSPRTSMTQSTTLQAASATAVATATSAVTAISSLDGRAQLIAIVSAVVAALGIAWMMRERIRKWARGDR
jgi:uncharacterized protein (TIGR02594 family)